MLQTAPESADGAELYLIETMPGETQWITEDKKWELRRVSHIPDIVRAIIGGACNTENMVAGVIVDARHHIHHTTASIAATFQIQLLTRICRRESSSWILQTLKIWERSGSPPRK